jgi:transposase
LKNAKRTKKHKGGRPTKKTPDRETLLLKAIEQGMPYKAACKISGLGFTTFNDWRDTDPSFALKLEVAEGVAIERNVEFIQAAASKDWKAAAWLLERRHPEMFARPEVQLNHQISIKAEENNLFIWMQPHAALPAPEGKYSALPIDIGDLELVCDAEAEV